MERRAFRAAGTVCAKVLRQEQGEPVISETLRPVWMGCSDRGWRVGRNRLQKASGYIVVFSPRTLDVERSSGAIPSAEQWSLPAGMWLKGFVLSGAGSGW